MTLSVDQKFWEIEEFRDKLLHIRHGLVGRETPRGVHGVKRPVWDIKALI